MSVMAVSNIENATIELPIRGRGAGRKFGFKHASELKPQPPAWIIEGYIEQSSTLIVYGKPESFKTFAVIDMCLHAAAGRRWHGHAVERQFTVAYVCGEGLRGIGRRVAGWCQHHSVEQADLTFFVSNMPGNFTDEQRRLEMIEALVCDLRGLRPDVLVVDTMARNLGADENDNSAINAMFDMIDAEIRPMNNCAVILVGHPGHTDQSRVRGGSALGGNADADALMQRGAGRVTTYQPRKMKDAPTPASMTFEAVEVPVLVEGADGQTEQATTLVLRHVPDAPGAEPPTPAEMMGSNQRTAIAALKDLYAAHRQRLADAGRDPAEAAVSITDWRDACVERGVARKRITEVVKALGERGLIHFEPPYVRISGE